MEISRISPDLKLTFPIRYTLSESGAVEPLVWAYHTPISRDVFEANYRAIAAANMTIFSKGIGFAAESGPIIATLALRDAARADALENGLAIAGDPAAPLLAEIMRLTMVLSPSSAGYETVPVEIALRGTIDAEEWREAEAALVFFTCGLWMTRRDRRDLKRSALASVLRGSITSLPPMEFAASLGTSTKPESSAVPAASSVPS